MKSETVRVLIVEQGEKCKALILNLLSQCGDCACIVENTADISRIPAALKNMQAQAVLFDMACQNSTTVFGAVKKFAADVPVLVLADPQTEAPAIEAIRKGAQDYLVKGGFDGKEFVRTMRAAIERQNVVVKLEKKSIEFQANEARLMHVVVNNVDGIIIIDTDKKIHFVNPVAERLFLQSASELMGRAFDYAVDLDGSAEIEIKRSDGNTKIIEMRTVKTQWDEKDAFLISLRDITERKQLEQKLKESEERYVLAIRGSKDGVWDWDILKNKAYFSSEWKVICGLGDDDIGNNPDAWFSRVHPDDIADLRSQIHDHLEGELSTLENEHRILHADGRFRWVVARGSAVFDEAKKAVRLAGSLRDITDRKEAEEGLKSALEELKFALASEKVLLEELDRKNRDLVELSITDGLTGLFNHRFIQERFSFEFKRAKRYSAPLSCMMLDIDHFKRINDTYGHQFGDMALRELAAIITKNSREVDICGRYGGEEFLIITTQNIDGAVAHATKLHKAVESHVFQNEQHSIHITVSIGVTEFKREITSKQEMIERCDIALYQAKRDGRNLIRVWKEEERSEPHTLDVEGISDLKVQVMSLSNQMRAAYMESTNALLKAVDAKDHYTLEHSENVSRYAMETARAMHFDDEEVEVIKNAGLLHDIGKIGIDKDILTKKGPLTRGEFEILKKHPMIGVNILEDVKVLEKEIPLIKHHHDWFDGNGYPQGLKEREIPFGALILGVADAYDAMMTDREFKAKMSPAQALKELTDGRGSQFCPEIVDAFVALLKNGNLDKKQ